MINSFLVLDGSERVVMNHIMRVQKRAVLISLLLAGIFLPSLGFYGNDTNANTEGAKSIINSTLEVAQSISFNKLYVETIFVEEHPVCRQPAQLIYLNFLEAAEIRLASLINLKNQRAHAPPSFA
jgi:hypothetical protein